jgi:hypothetical protein
MTEYYKQGVVSFAGLSAGENTETEELTLSSEVGSLYAAKLLMVQFGITEFRMDVEGLYDVRVSLSVGESAPGATRSGNKAVVPWVSRSFQVYVPEAEPSSGMGGFSLVSALGGAITPPQDVILPADSINFDVQVYGPECTSGKTLVLEAEILYDVAKRSTNALYAASLMFGDF